MPLNLVNLTPFRAGLKVGMRLPGEYRLTVLLKAAYRLVPGGTVTPADEQLFPSGDVPYADDEEGKGPPRYASDFAPFKPKTDILIAGWCHPDRPTAQCDVKATVGKWSKTLRVSGARAWKPSTFGQKPTDPAVFDKLELRYEHTYGGEGFDRNPAGMGITERTTPSGRVYVPVPHIEDPRDLVKSRRSKPEPAGFGPIPLEWPQRVNKAGSYKGDYAKERWPNYAKDMDWTLFNAAPEDQQIEYLQGDEPIELTHLHARHPKLKTKLPGLRARCVRHDHPDRTTGAEWTEIPLRADTLWIDPESDLLVVVWRGVTQVDAVTCAEIDALVFDMEPLATPLELEHFKQALVAAPPEPVEPEPPLISPELEAEIAAAEAEMEATFVASGFDRDGAEPDAKSKAIEDELLATYADQLPPEALTRETVAARLKSGESLDGEVLAGLDLTGLPLAGVSLCGANLVEARLAGTDLTGTRFTGAILERADLSGCQLAEANLSGVEADGINLNRAVLTRCVLEQGTFVGAQCQGADFTEAQGAESVWEGADFSDARFPGAAFTAAQLTRARLDRVDFREADFSEAVFEDAAGESVNWHRLTAPKLRASRAQFPGGIFTELKAPESGWDDAQLSGSDFTYAVLTGSDFSEAILDKAKFSAVHARGASFARTRFRDAFLLKSDLLGASLEGANLSRADCRGSNFFEAEFLEAVTGDTRFELCNLKMTKLAP